VCKVSQDRVKVGALSNFTIILTWWKAKKWKRPSWFKDLNRFLIKGQHPVADVVELYTLLPGILVTTQETSHWAFRKPSPVRIFDDMLSELLSGSDYLSAIARGTSILSVIVVGEENLLDFQHVMNAISWNTPFLHILTQMIAKTSFVTVTFPTKATDL
jgi:hypothetical protein